MADRWIDAARKRYRAAVTGSAALPVYGLDERGPERAIGVFAAWGMRYQHRRNAIEGIRGADRHLADLLEERQRAADLSWPGEPDYPPEILPWTEGFALSRWTGVAPLEPHPHGPSLRRLWLEGAAGAADLHGRLDHVLAWARAPVPPPGEAPPRAVLSREVAWSRTDDPEAPWGAEVDGQRWALRLGDFPDRAAWTLLVDGRPSGELDEWPEAWSRGPRPVARGPVVVGQAAARWPARYRAGEREAVWTELVALGPDVRAEGHLAPAREVARMTMGRARHDLELLLARLRAADYRFGSADRPASEVHVAVGGAGGGPRVTPLGALLDRLPGAGALKGLLDAVTAARAAPPHVPHVPPDPADAEAVARSAARGLHLPLALEAWIVEVGIVDLVGSHPVLCPLGRALDPLVVRPWAVSWADALQETREAWREAGEPVELPIGFGPQDKADLAAGADPGIDGGPACLVPELAADAVIEGGAGETLVQHVRRSLANGGFAGWAGDPSAPRELAALTDGFVGI